ncbi:MAG TPA: methyltransferase domain-containing protein [Gemmatimonadaceae bacterium]|nr:methyltransferase domain-containing protein [Gemmatimonadaceae bacterium]
MTHDTDTPRGKSFVMHSAAGYYDRLVWLVTSGRERALRARFADLARLAPGESVLDVGCGTGSLALEARRRVGPGGMVAAVDAAPEMIARARRKAARTGLTVAFEAARAESLPFADGRFDVVLGTLMVHHLSRPVREQLAREIRRVLRPGGRVLLVDFEPSAGGGGSFISRLHRHGHVPLREIVALLRDVGLRVDDVGSVGFGDLRFALARNEPASVAGAEPVHRALPPLPRPRWLVATATAVVVGVHALVLHLAASWLALAAVAAGVLVLLAIATHVNLAGGVHAILRRHARR